MNANGTFLTGIGDGRTSVGRSYTTSQVHLRLERQDVDQTKGHAIQTPTASLHLTDLGQRNHYRRPLEWTHFQLPANLDAKRR